MKKILERVKAHVLQDPNEVHDMRFCMDTLHKVQERVLYLHHECGFQVTIDEKKDLSAYFRMGEDYLFLTLMHDEKHEKFVEKLVLFIFQIERLLED